jgi:hypothetical protein
MENLDLTKILKDCPKGIELYSPMYGLGILTKVTNRIHVKFPKEHNVKCFRPDGKVSEDGEIMLFPKGKTTWEEFKRPFVDGDVIVGGDYIGLYETYRKGNIITHCSIDENLNFILGEVYYCFGVERLATEEEKQKLFDAIKANGYKWNSETKTLKELKKEKFDPKTLQPFDKVIVRDEDGNTWCISLFGWMENYDAYPFHCGEERGWVQCVPYNDETKHLIGTTQQAPSKYITWE